MQDKVTFEYAVIRLVPKVEREEFLNIGVLLFSKRKKYLEMQFKIDEKRITAFCGETDLAMIRQYLQAWELICKGHPDGGPIGALDIAQRFRWLASHRSSILQTSRIHPGICSEPDKVLEKLFVRFVC